MLVIAIRFPAGGRYHATTWGSHANEGVPEWPPSPWRLLRALIATARWKSGRATSEEPPRLRPLIEALAAAPPPSYALPAAAAAHTRHYMPLGDDSTTKVFDTFVHPATDAAAARRGEASTEPIVIMWDASLDAAGREYLAALLGRMNYFGRAESLCEAELLPPETEPMSAPNAFPVAPGQPLDPDKQTFKLMAPQAPSDYTGWRASCAASEPQPGKRRGKSRNGEAPADLFEALHLDTAEWRGAGWSQPPGSRWVEYARPATPFRLAAPPPRHMGRPQPGIAGPAVARYAVQSAVRESITKALSLGERMHVALCARSDAVPVFSGQCDGQSLSGHGHAFYLPECDHRGLITHVTVFARMGFGDVAVEALRSLRQTWSRGSPGLKLVLLGSGGVEEFRTLPALGKAREWSSLTPFVPVRHIKRSRNGKPRVDTETGLVRGSSAHDLRRLIVENGLPAPLEIESLGALQLPGRRIRWANFQRERRQGAGAGIVTRSGYGFRLRFGDPVSGPLAFGYGAHFGLGLFIPVADEKQ
jgi:CRISPR-associated protein Csb2